MVDVSPVILTINALENLTLHRVIGLVALKEP